MPWLRLDDGFADHPKIVEAGPLASWLHVCGMLYCARQLTDGFIPSGQLRKLADVDDAPALAARLIDAGLWEHVDSGYQVHDYLLYNRSRAQVLAERAAAQERMQRRRSSEQEPPNDGTPSEPDATFAETSGEPTADVRANNGRTSGDVTPVVQLPRTQSRTVTPPSPVPKPTKPRLAANAPPEAREPDERWDTLVAQHGFSPLPGSPEHGRWNKACGIWRALGASPADMRQVYAEYGRRYPTGDNNANAIAGRAEHLLAEIRRQRGQGATRRDWVHYDQQEG